MPELRERKQAEKPAASLKQEEEDTSKLKPVKRNEEVDLEPNIYVLSLLFVAFTLVVGTLLFYKVDNRENGQFAQWVNEKFPIVDQALNRRPSPPAFGAAAQEVPVAGDLKLTEEELKAYDGTDPDRPIYLGINGTIFDVSASPAFYGPGGHYNHFVGKDATRAWITECWDEAEQFTWRLDDVHVMFMPKWLDEQVDNAANNPEDKSMGDLGGVPKDMVAGLAKKALERFGSITDSEKKRRRKEDREEAEAKVQETLAHWVGFFAGNAKYKVAGSVVRDETRPTPPEPCEAAMKKRPLKGGKLEPLMNGLGGLGGMMGGAGGGAGGEQKAKMPDFVKDKLAKDKAKKEEEVVEEVELGGDEDEDLVHEEL